MGFIRDRFGRITVEERSESFIDAALNDLRGARVKVVA